MRYSIQSAKTIEEAIDKGLEELDLTREEVDIEVIEEPSKGFLGFIGSKDAIVKVTENVDTQDLLDEIFEDPIKDTKKTSSSRPKKKKNISKPEKKSKSVDKKVEDKKVQEDKTKKSDKTEVKKENKQEESIETEEESLEPKLTDEEIEEISTEFLEKVLDPMNIEYDFNMSHEINRDRRQINIEIEGRFEELGIVIGKRGVTLDAIQYVLSLIINRHSKEYIRVALDCSNYRAKREKTLEELAEKMAKKTLKTSRPVRLEPMNAAERRIIHKTLQSYEGVSTYSEGREPYRRIVIQREIEY